MCRWRYFLYGDPAPSIGEYIKLIQIQTRTNLGNKPQWKKWCQIQNLLGILQKLFGKAKLKGFYPKQLSIFVCKTILWNLTMPYFSRKPPINTSSRLVTLKKLVGFPKKNMSHLMPTIKKEWNEVILERCFELVIYLIKNPLCTLADLLCRGKQKKRKWFFWLTTTNVLAHCTTRFFLLSSA